MTQIHPTAVVAPGAELGDGVRIGPYAVIDDKAVVGDGARIGSHVHVGGFCHVGKNCELFHGANLDTPQDYSWKPEDNVESYLELGEGTVVREYVTVHRPAKPGHKTVVGAHCMLMAFTHVAHDVQLADNVTLANHATLSGFVQVGIGAVVSGHVMVHQFCRIGARAFVSPRVNLRQDVPPFCLVSDDGCVRGLNVIALKRSGMTPARREALRQAVKTTFLKGMSRPGAIAEIESWEPTEELALFLDFLRFPTRFGLVPGPAKAAKRAAHLEA